MIHVAIAKALSNRSAAIAACKCAWCGEDARTFKDEISGKEYLISGFCQSCQDKTFGGGEDE